jgi:hypothetical protein
MGQSETESIGMTTILKSSANNVETTKWGTAMAAAVVRYVDIEGFRYGSITVTKFPSVVMKLPITVVELSCFFKVTYCCCEVAYCSEFA